MLRLIGAVLLGYIAMVIIVFCGMSLAWLVLGADGAFQTGTYDVSAIWILVSCAIAFVAALAGGWLARVVTQNARGPRVLAGFVVVLGIVLAIPALTGSAPETGARPDAVPMFEAIANARTPLWVMLISPLIGAVGVLIGGRALRGEKAVAMRDVDGERAGSAVV